MIGNQYKQNPNPVQDATREMNTTDDIRYKTFITEC